MYIACLRGRLSMCKWLVLKGALTSVEVGEHTDLAVVRRSIPESGQRTALLQWATDYAAAISEFQHAVLPGTVSQRKSSQLWKLNILDDETNSALKILVADFVGLPHGRQLRNVREAAEALTTVLAE
jgi:hypothetical protein